MPARKKVGESFLSPLDLRALHQLPRTDQVWIGERRSTDLVDDENETLDLCIWYDATHDLLRAVHPLPWGSDASALVTLIVQALQEPDTGEPCLPAELQVGHKEEAEKLQEALHALGIRVQVIETPLRMDEVFERVERLMKFPEVWNYLEEPGVSSDQVARLHDAAVRACALVDWSREDEAPRPVAGLRETPMWLSMMKTESDMRSLVFMFTDEAPEELAGLMLEGGGGIERLMGHLKTLSLVFVPVEEMAPEMIGLARQEGWKVTPDALLPLLIRMPSEGQMELPDAGEIGHVVHALEHLVRESERPRFREGDRVFSLESARARKKTTGAAAVRPERPEKEPPRPSGAPKKNRPPRKK